MIDFITLCDYVGTFAFAISGIRLASAKKFDWFGAYVVGVVTAVGGGTIRDVGTICRGRYCQDPRLRFPHVGGHRHGNDNRSFRRYDAGYSD